MKSKTSMTPRIFLSSTFQDLKEYRNSVYIVLRRLGNVVKMEDYPATDQTPLEKALEDVKSSDIVVFLVAWRYGYIPFGQQYSITELELRTAKEAGIPCLIFLASEKAPLQVKYIDQDSANIQRFRQQLQENFVVSYFNTPDELATQVATSLQRWAASGKRELSPTPPGVALDEELLRPDVFLSYAHEDIKVAQSVSERIGQENWTVFWDRTIPVGFTWDDIVEGALDVAKCVVVLWSTAARNSEWVRIEATEGAERKILAPALIEQTKIPLRFRLIQAANLVGWIPNAVDTTGMKSLISAISRFVRNKDRSTT